VSAPQFRVLLGWRGVVRFLRGSVGGLCEAVEEREASRFTPEEAVTLAALYGGKVVL
jgi:hypothetical protein